MTLLVHNDVQESEPWSIRVFLRELNTRLRDIRDTFNNNHRNTMSASVSFTTGTNGTQCVWIASEIFDLESVSVVGTTAAGSIDLKIGGVAVGGGTFAVTTSVVEHTITAPNATVDLDDIELVTAGLTGQCCITLNLRRVN